MQRVPLSSFKLPLFSLSVPFVCLPPSLLQDCAETEVDRNKCCTLCNMFFTSAIVAQSHYQGKTHAKRVRLVLGEPPNLSSVASLTNAGRIHSRLSSYRQNCSLDKQTKSLRTNIMMAHFTHTYICCTVHPWRKSRF